MVRTIRLLHLRPLRMARLRSALVVVAVAAGVTLGLAVFIEYQSVVGSIDQTGRQLAGVAPLRVVGAVNGALTPEQLAAARSTPGVAAAVPVIQNPTQAVTSSGDDLTVLAVGVDCSVQRLLGALHCLVAPTPGTTPAPLISRSLAHRLGPRGAVRTDLGRVPTARATSAGLDRIGGGRVVVFPMSEAQQLYSRNGYDAIYVLPTKGASLQEVRSALERATGPGTAVLGASDRPVLVTEAVNFLPIMVVIAGIAAVIAAMLVFSIVSLSLTERRRDLAVGSALGRRPGHVIGGALMEAALLGLAGGALGVGGAIVVAHLLVGSIAGVSTAIGVPITVHLTAMAVGLGPALGAVIGIAAAWLPARRASRVDVAAELYDRAPQTNDVRRGRARLSVLSGALSLVGLAVALAAGWRGSSYTWQDNVGNIGLFLGTVGALGVAVFAGPQLLQLLRGLTGRLTGVTHLAGTNVGSDAGRSGAALLAVAAVVTIGGVIGGLTPAITAGSARFTHDAMGNAVYISGLDTSYVATNVGVSPRVEAAVAHVPGVDRVDRQWIVHTGERPDDYAMVLANDHELLRLPVDLGTADRAALARGEAFIGTGLARTRNLQPGSTLRLATPRGPVGVKVAAVWEDPDNNGWAATVSPALLTRLYGPQRPYDLAVVPARGISADALAARIRAAHLDPDLNVWSPRQFTAANVRAVANQIAQFRVVQWAIVGVVLVAILATLLLVGVQRRRELAVLGAVGLSPARLFRMTLVETALVAFVGCALGLIGAIANGAGILRQAYLFGMTPPLRFAFGSMLLISLAAFAAALAGAIWPARRTARVPIAEALHYE